jgi:hypothetical protein
MHQLGIHKPTFYKQRYISTKKKDPIYPAHLYFEQTKGRMHGLGQYDRGKDLFSYDTSSKT